MDSELRGPASTLLDIVDIVSRATSVYYFHPSPPSNVVYRQCVHAILHTNIEREEGGGGSELCTNKRVCLGRSSDLVIMFYSWTRHFAITVTLFYGLFYDSFISPVFFLYIVQGPVVRRPISANPGVNFNLGFLIPLLKSLFGIIFSVLFKVSNSHTLD